MLEHAKEDGRPAKGGWVPGGKYICECHKCGERYIGHKRSFTCADCAYAAVES